jgi:hypothetical protein
MGNMVTTANMGTTATMDTAITAIMDTAITATMDTAIMAIMDTATMATIMEEYMVDVPHPDASFVRILTESFVELSLLTLIIIRGSC